MKWRKQLNYLMQAYVLMEASYRRLLAVANKCAVFDKQRHEARETVLAMYLEIQTFRYYSRIYLHRLEELNVVPRLWHLVGPNGYNRARRLNEMYVMVDTLFEHINLFIKTDLPEYGHAYYHDHAYMQGYPA